MSEDAFADGDPAYSDQIEEPLPAFRQAAPPAAATPPHPPLYPRAAVTIASTSPSSGNRPVSYLE
jgi:hypothetical protein